MKFKCVLIALLPLLFISSNCFAQEEKDRDWVNQHFSKILDEIFPLQQVGGFIINFRSNRDLYTDVLEYYFSIKKDYQGNPIEVTVRIADSISIYDQIMKLHLQNPKESIDEIKKGIKIKEWRFTEKDFPDVRRLFQKYKKIRFNTVSDKPEFTLHPVIYRFYMDGPRESMELSITDPRHPLVLWALRAMKSFESYLANKERKTISKTEKAS
jgi:hypothetical protein